MQVLIAVFVRALSVRSQDTIISNDGLAYGVHPAVACAIVDRSLRYTEHCSHCGHRAGDNGAAMSFAPPHRVRHRYHLRRQSVPQCIRSPDAKFRKGCATPASPHWRGHAADGVVSGGTPALAVDLYYVRH